MSNRAFTKNSPDRATELFAKLLETSDTAIKTRERLFSELKEELELLARLQEQHLYPILRKHTDTRDLVQSAISDNMETAALMAELEPLPKNDAEFIKKVSNLRKIFQQHIRDDKNELLPAVLRVLSGDEAEAVAEQVVEDMAAGRTEAKRERDQVAGETAAGVEAVARSGAQGVQRMALETQNFMASGLSAAFELSRTSTNQLIGLVSLSSRDLPDLTATTARAFSSTGILASGTQAISREWLRLSQERMHKSLDAFAALADCRSVQDLFAVQSSLVTTNLQQMAENSRRMAELYFEVGKDVAGANTDNAEPERSGRRAA